MRIAETTNTRFVLTKHEIAKNKVGVRVVLTKMGSVFFWTRARVIFSFNDDDRDFFTDYLFYCLSVLT